MNIAQLPTANDRCLHSRFGPARIRRWQLGPVQWTVVMLGTPPRKGKASLRVALELRERGCPLESMLESSPGALERRLVELGRAGGGVVIFAADAEVASRGAAEALCQLMDRLADEFENAEHGCVWHILPGSSRLHHSALDGWAAARSIRLEWPATPVTPGTIVPQPVALSANSEREAPTAKGKLARPWVTSSHAQTLDGTIAGTSRAPLLLSGEHSMAFAHRLRVEHDAVLVGVNTVISDDPRLTARLVEGEHPRPVILDSRLRTPCHAEIFRHPRSPVIYCTDDAPLPPQRALEAQGATVYRLPADAQGQVELTAVLAALERLGVARLLVEGGATILSRFLAGGFVDEVVMTLAPRLSSGLRATNELLGFAVPLAITSVSQMGDDIVLRAKPMAPQTSAQRVFAQRP